MKRWIGMAVLVFVATAGWRIGEALSPDALSMAVGILFGVLAGVPTALLVMAAARGLPRRREAEERSRQPERGYPVRPDGAWGQPYFPPQPPVIVVAPHALGPGGPATMEPAAWSQSRRDRQFKVVGEAEEWMQE